MSAVSVIIPTYNRRTLLPEAIDSVLSQTCGDLEVLVVDDGSTDGTMELQANYRDRVRFIKSRHTGLPAAARNIGLKAAAGKYIAFLDSDDRWAPDKLRRQVDLMESNPGTGMVCANALMLEVDGQAPHKPYLALDKAVDGKLLDVLVRNNIVITSTVLARRDVLEKAGRFSQEWLLRGIEDYDLWLRVSAITGISYMPDALALYRTHGNRISSRGELISHYKGLIRVYDRLSRFLRRSGISAAGSEGLIADSSYACRLQLFDHYAARGARLNARAVLWRLAQIRPENRENIKKYVRARQSGEGAGLSITAFVSPWRESGKSIP